MLECLQYDPITTNMISNPFSMSICSSLLLFGCISSCSRKCCKKSKILFILVYILYKHFFCANIEYIN